MRKAEKTLYRREAIFKDHSKRKTPGCTCTAESAALGGKDHAAVSWAACVHAVPTPGLQSSSGVPLAAQKVWEAAVSPASKAVTGSS